MNLQILVLSLWMLFLELFLIRWISTEIRLFAYVNNLALLACFIGIGLGCYQAGFRRTSAADFRQKYGALSSIIFLTVLVLGVRSGLFTQITEFLGGFSDSVIWDQALASTRSLLLWRSLAGIFLTIAVFGLVAAVFAPVGWLLGGMLDGHPKIIAAYSLNIVGSLLGIWLFCGLSFLFAPPWIWLLVSVILGLLFVPRRVGPMLGAVLCALVSLAALVSAELKSPSTWSPYQKLKVVRHLVGPVSNGYDVFLNNTSFMHLYDLSAAFAEKHYDPSLQMIRRVNQYEIPCQLKGGAADVLIVGAGGGNDVAGALRQGPGRSTPLKSIQASTRSARGCIRSVLTTIRGCTSTSMTRGPSSRRPSGGMT